MLFYNTLYMNIINEKINDIAIKEYKGNNSTFAKIMGTSEANIRNYRKGTMPKLDFVVKLHEVLELSFDFLLSEKSTAHASKKVEDKTAVDDQSIQFKKLSLENELLIEKLKFQSEQIDFYKNQIAFLTTQVPMNKALNAKEIEDGLNIIDEIENISLKKSGKSVK
jgi:transcriptional regulator with XRE-family HTH domain